MKVAVVGSGLAAVAALKVLISRGVKPVVLDIGKTLDQGTQDAVTRMSTQHPENWAADDLQLTTANPTISRKHEFPQKLAFGSDYFYGRPGDIHCVGEKSGLPPFSHAKGGFSAGWGSSILPPDDCDLNGWPIGNDVLSPYFREVLSDLPYSAAQDDLARVFPLFANPAPIRITKGCESLMQDLRRSALCKDENIAFGQARVLTAATDSGKYPQCNYCGYCMSGCVYGSIYKSSQDIDRMVANGAIDYLAGHQVESLEESEGKVTLKYTFGNRKESMVFDRVFLAAGAVGSTRIILRSKRLYEQLLTLKSTDGFVVALLRVKKSKMEWPMANTQPGVFLEFKTPGFSNHWVHSQISTPNELVLKRLGIVPGAGGIGQSLRRFAAEQIMIAHCNLHSDHSSAYKMRLVNRAEENGDEVVCTREPHPELDEAIRKTVNQLSSIARRAACLTLKPLMQTTYQSGSFHLGGSMPMRHAPESDTDTNLLGNPRDCTRIHIIDSSVFPSLPGTTIGLLAMANATRVATESSLD